MNHLKTWIYLLGLTSILLLFTACGTPQTDATPEPPIATQAPPTLAPSPIPPTATPVPSVYGTVTSWGAGSSIAGRHVVLCQIVGEQQESPADCVLMETAAITGEDGTFQLYNVPSGAYYVLYDSGRSDFDDGLERWGGQTLSWDDRELQMELFGVEDSDEGWVLALTPEGYQFEDNLNFLLSYFPATLLLGDSPFVMAHDLEQAVNERELELVVIDVVDGQPSAADFMVVKFRAGEASGLEILLFE